MQEPKAEELAIARQNSRPPSVLRRGSGPQLPLRAKDKATGYALFAPGLQACTPAVTNSDLKLPDARLPALDTSNVYEYTVLVCHASDSRSQMCWPRVRKGDFFPAAGKKAGNIRKMAGDPKFSPMKPDTCHLVALQGREFAVPAQRNLEDGVSKPCCRLCERDWWPGGHRKLALTMSNYA